MSTSPTTTMIDTRKVKGRRKVRYESYHDLLADAERLVALDAQGKVRPLGNMQLGQALGHLALWMNASVDGVPEDLRPPAPLKVAAKMMKGMILNKGIMPGFKLPPDAAGKLIPPASMTPAEAFQKLSAGCSRLRIEGKRAVSPLLGKLTVEEWDKLHLRHAELHLSFMQIAE